jgi:hypothetical protein
MTGPFAQVAAQIADENLRQQALDQQAAQLHAQTRASVRESQVEFAKLQATQDRWQADKDIDAYWKGLDFDLRTQELMDKRDQREIDNYLKMAGLDVSKGRLATEEARNQELAKQYRQTEARLALTAAAKDELDRASTQSRLENEQLTRTVNATELAVNFGQVYDPNTGMTSQITPAHPLWNKYQEKLKATNEKRTAEKEAQRREAAYKFSTQNAAALRDDYDRALGNVARATAQMDIEQKRWKDTFYPYAFPDPKTERGKKAQDDLNAAMEPYRKLLKNAEKRAEEVREEWSAARKKAEALGQDVDSSGYGFQAVPTPPPVSSPAAPIAVPESVMDVQGLRSLPPSPGGLPPPEALLPGQEPGGKIEILASPGFNRAMAAERESRPGGSLYDPTIDMPEFKGLYELERGGNVGKGSIAGYADWYGDDYASAVELRKRHGFNSYAEYKEAKWKRDAVKVAYSLLQQAIRQHPEKYANPQPAMFQGASKEQLDALLAQTNTKWTQDVFKHLGLDIQKFRKAVRAAESGYVAPKRFGEPRVVGRT